MRERNEALDCRIYARAAAIAIGVDRWSKARWETMRPVKNEDSDEQVQEKIAEKKRPRVVKSMWI
jgi:phage terminase large subunit GpA-like protein